jgi:hypothetical protein
MRGWVRGLISWKTNTPGVAAATATTDSSGLNSSHPQRFEEQELMG